jgi:DNA transformation protein
LHESFSVPVSEGFKEFVRDLLAQFRPVVIRNMFGGAGVYADGVMFAILANDAFYLKVDETSARAFADEGMQPFSYQTQGREPIAMSYWEVPPRLLEEPRVCVTGAGRAPHRLHIQEKPPRTKRRSQ